MASRNTGFVNVDSAKLYYEIGGEAHNETLVLVHAGIFDSGMWDSQWDSFAGHYRVVRFDMRGFGKSDLAQGPVCRRQDLYAALTQLGVKRAHLVGCSLGGETIIDFALEHPEMVSSLIVISATPGGFQMQGEPPALLMEMFAAMQQGDVNRASVLQIRVSVDGPFREPEQVDPAVRRRAAEMNLIAMKNGTAVIADMQPLNPLNPPAVSRLKSIRVPTLIIAGALDHPELLRAADVMASEIPGAKKLIIAETAHIPNMEKPTEFNQAVLEFLGATAKA